MLSALRALYCWGLRSILSLRYRVRFVGGDALRRLRGPILIVPNHPGLIDPALVLSNVWPYAHPRPMAFESNLRNPVLAPVVKLFDVVRVPDTNVTSAGAQTQARAAVQEVIDGLHRGETHILWPAGHIQKDGLERLGSARALSDILAAVPEANVVALRTRGVRGSMFTWAPTGTKPVVHTNQLLQGIGIVLSNLLFFTPRRNVEIAAEVLDRSKIPAGDRTAVNRYFESWYNAPGQEPPVFVPYHFLVGPRTIEFPPPKVGGDLDLSGVADEVKAAVAGLIAETLKRPAGEEFRQPETGLDELGLDSLGRMELTLNVERRFGFSAGEVPETVGQLWALAAGMLSKGEAKPAPPEWFVPASNADPVEPLADTIDAAFLKRALSSKRDAIVADDLAGTLTYEKMLVGVWTLRKRLAKLPAPNVGLMLPASVAADLAFYALRLAGKLPVMLNWTTGPSNLAHAAKVMGLTHVVTSRAFIDRVALDPVGLDGQKADWVFLEDFRKDIRSFEKLRTLLAVRYWDGFLRRLAARPLDPDAPAVVLFTSGSEKAPKAVPLSHANILADMRGLVRMLDIRRTDSLIGFLPAFHSFGLSVTVVMTAVAGVRVVHHPDPTDAGGLVRKLAAYKPTLMVATPTFVSYILDRAKSGENPLGSLRLVAVGAEKCPDAVFRRFHDQASQAMLLEGYGITECSPVVSVNAPNANRVGSLGKPVLGVEVRVVDLDTQQPLPVDQLGMLWVSGPTVFGGYLAHDGPSPFVEADGKRWYVTGDLAKLDADGFLHFGGRLKRFLKAGGEMVSLPALEEPFADQYPAGDDGPQVAVEGVETDGGRAKIVLFATVPIDLAAANATLKEKGFQGVMRLDEVRRVDRIPVLGTGKTDYKQLRAMLAG